MGAPSGQDVRITGGDGVLSFAADKSELISDAELLNFIADPRVVHVSPPIDLAAAAAPHPTPEALNQAEKPRLEEAKSVDLLLLSAPNCFASKAPQSGFQDTTLGDLISLGDISTPSEFSGACPELLKICDIGTSDATFDSSQKSTNAPGFGRRVVSSIPLATEEFMSICMHREPDPFAFVSDHMISAA